jgi:hypothetical protein
MAMCVREQVLRDRDRRSSRSRRPHRAGERGVGHAHAGVAGQHDRVRAERDRSGDVLRRRESSRRPAGAEVVVGDKVRLRVDRFEVDRDEPSGEPFHLAHDVGRVGHLDGEHRRPPDVEQVEDQQVRTHRRRQLGVADVVHGGHHRRDHLRGEDASLAAADGRQHVLARVGREFGGGRVEQALDHRDLPAGAGGPVAHARRLGRHNRWAWQPAYQGETP